MVSDQPPKTQPAHRKAQLAETHRERIPLLTMCRRLRTAPQVVLLLRSTSRRSRDKNMFSPTRSCGPQAGLRTTPPLATLLPRYLCFRLPGDDTHDRCVAPPRLQAHAAPQTNSAQPPPP